LSNSLIF
jgi:hypothetical protein